MRTLAVGDFIVYPAQGVGRLVDQTTRVIDGHLIPAFSIEILGRPGSIWLPLDKVTSLGVRPIIGHKQALALLDVFERPSPWTRDSSWVHRCRVYRDWLDSGLAEDAAQVLRDLFRLRSRRNLSFEQRRMLGKGKTHGNS